MEGEEEGKCGLTRSCLLGGLALMCRNLGDRIVGLQNPEIKASWGYNIPRLKPPVIKDHTGGVLC